MSGPVSGAGDWKVLGFQVVRMKTVLMDPVCDCV